MREGYFLQKVFQEICPHLIVFPESPTGMCLCAIPAWESGEDTFCDEWALWEGEIISLEDYKKRRKRTK